LLLFSWPALGAQSLDSRWRALDDQELLQEAASVIEKLRLLNADLKKEASEALKKSKELSAGLEILRKELAESKKIRTELVTALKISEELWKSYGKEAEKEVHRRTTMAIGLGIAAGLGISWIATLIL
jgi:hypothetical protein